MNFHSDEWINNKVKEHYYEATQHFEPTQIVGIFLQGSQNYGLDYKNSDVDTKLIVTPSLSDLVYNRTPVSTTHIRENNEHIDFKDIRLYMETFKKQNLNFLEILFTDYYIINPLYQEIWQKLVDNRELIARMDVNKNVASIQGVAMNKFCALQHPYPSKLHVLEKFGYDPKQLHHLLRVYDFLPRFIAGESYIDCMHPLNSEYLLSVKEGLYNEEEACKLAKETIAGIDSIGYNFREQNKDKQVDSSALQLLNEVQYEIMYKAIYTNIEQKGVKV